MAGGLGGPVLFEACESGEAARQAGDEVAVEGIAAVEESHGRAACDECGGGGKQRASWSLRPPQQGEARPGQGFQKGGIVGKGRFRLQSGKEGRRERVSIRSLKEHV